MSTGGPATSSTSISSAWPASSSPGHRVQGDRTCETRGAGYEYLHIAIDDHSRISFAAILPDQTSASAQLFFRMTGLYYSRFGFSCRRVLTDNGPCYRDGTFRRVLHRQHIRHRFTRPTSHVPTERQNASSRPHCESGLMPAPIRTPQLPIQP
ncbi:DDE-type integrase/transposase/recombinase [Edaphobacter paludis]|uniref:DDE-type integrase/transposase/recombinase n=1 Tax=Edaphobacter paludis TaxID=3035702 RepID=A0AAU7CYM9_9BACT